RRHFWNVWLIPLWIPRLPQTGPVSERRRQMLALCGLQLRPARYNLRIPEQDQRWAAEEVPAGAIHLSINASRSLKERPPENWIEMARQLSERDGGAPIRCPAGGGQGLEGVGAALRPGAQVFQGLSIARLAALLERCRLHVGADSGVLHLAVALGKPTVSLFRDSAGVKGWLPAGLEHSSIVVP